MKKRNNIKKEVTKIKKTEYSKVNKRRKQREPDLWEEIRSSLKPLGKAYNKFREKRIIAKQKEEERRVDRERTIEKEKKTKEEKERRLKEQERQRLEEKRIIEKRDKRIKQEQVYKEKLIKGEDERIKQLKRVSESREEERKLRDERNLKIERKFIEEQKLKEGEQRLKEEGQRLKEEEKRLQEEEQRLKEKEQRLKEEEKINLKKVRRSDDEQNKKRLNGTVLWFNDSKGYGFIKREDKEKDVFVHFSAVQSSGLEYLKKGDQLTFEVDYSDKGHSAINLKKIANEISHSHLKVVK